MIRKFSLATALVAAIALPAVAEDKKMIDPSGSKGPTETMTDQVPKMKRDAEAIKEAGPDPTTPLPSSKAVGAAVPSMRPGDAVSGQPDSQSSPNAAAQTTPARDDNAAITTQDALLLIVSMRWAPQGAKIFA